MKRLLPVLCVIVLSCAPGEFGAGAKMANTVLAGAACGMAAANDTPCTPRAVLDALARDAAAQKAKVEAVAPQASAADPELTKAILAQLEANTASNKKLTEAIVLLAARAPEPVPTAPTSSALPAAPPASSSAPVPAVTP